MRQLTDILRLNKVYGVDGKIPVGKSKFYQDYVHHTEDDPYIPNTDIKRLKVVPLGPRCVGVFSDEVNALIEALRAARDSLPKAPSPHDYVLRKQSREQNDQQRRRREQNDQQPVRRGRRRLEARS
jgi:hypothetical protein